MDSKIKELFKRYQSGTASPAERALVENWFASFEPDEEFNLSEENKAILFKSMDSAIQKRLHPRSSAIWFKAAAILLVSLSAGLFIYRINSRKQAMITYTVIKVPNGQKKEIALPDSSIVFLNSGSSVSIPSNFGDHKREISLTGEAFFIIKHNALKPFTLRADKLTISDIGTSFNVKAYPGDKQISVAVKTGKVGVAKQTPAGKPEVFANAMTAGQQMIYDRTKNTHTLSTVPADGIAAWRNNQLRFDNASFEEIAAQLERWYNVTVKLNINEKQGRRYTISFANEPIDRVLKVLSKLSGATYEINNRNISINLKQNKNMN